MLTILFISDDSRVADIVARFQPQLKARMRLALDFDQGLKEVFDNRPSAVFIQGDISGISGETVARHIKTLLRSDAPRIVLMHASTPSVQGTKKWFDDAVDVTLSPTELIESFRLLLREIAPGHWLDQHDVPPGNPEVPFSVLPPSDILYAPPAAGEFDTFDWESPGSVIVPAESPAVHPLLPDAKEKDGTQAVAALQIPDGKREVDAVAGVTSAASDDREEMPSIQEESATTQSDLLQQVPAATIVDTPPKLRPRDTDPVKASSPSPSTAAATADDHFAAYFADFKAEKPVGSKAEWVTVPSPDQEDGERTSRRLTIWSAAIVLLLIGAMAGGALFLKGRGGGAGTSGSPGAKVAVPDQFPPAPVSVPKVAPAPTNSPAAGLPSFVPALGKDQQYGKAHPGWERYRSAGIEYRLFREHGRLKAVQILANGDKAIPESLVASVVKELTGSESHTVSSRTKSGGYRREAGKVDGKGEVVIYRNRGGIRGIVVTLG